MPGPRLAHKVRTDVTVLPVLPRVQPELILVVLDIASDRYHYRRRRVSGTVSCWILRDIFMAHA